MSGSKFCPIVLIAGFLLYAQPDTTGAQDSVPPARDTVIVLEAIVADTLATNAVSLFETVDTLADPIPDLPVVQTGSRRSVRAGNLEWGIGTSWSILIVPQVDEWRDSIRANILNDSLQETVHVIDRDFNSYNNTISPSATIVWNASPNVSLSAEGWGFWMRKRIAYSDASSSYEEQLLLRGVPISLWLFARIPKDVFEIKDYGRLHLGVALWGLPWVGIRSSGHLQRNLSASGQAIGFAFSVGAQRELGQRWRLGGDMQYSLARANLRTNTGKPLAWSRLIPNKPGEFEMDLGSLRFLMRFTLCKPRRASPPAGSPANPQSQLRGRQTP